MEGELKISVAMATYNGSLYLSGQLLSLGQQVCKPAELVVVDDSSSDETVDIIRQFSKNASFPVRLTVNNERMGPARTFFRAANLCDSEIIAFCDQDDIWDPHKLQKCKRYFSDNDVVLVAHSMENYP